MEVKVCRRCRRMFQYVAGPQICPKCKKQEEEMFQKVKDYLRENPGATMSEVSDETEVPVPLIENFLREGRLQVAERSPIPLKCVICGTRIVTGKYCAKCKAKLMGELSEAANSLKEKPKEDKGGDRMHYLRSDNIQK